MNAMEQVYYMVCWEYGIGDNISKKKTTEALESNAHWSCFQDNIWIQKTRSEKNGSS